MIVWGLSQSYRGEFQDSLDIGWKVTSNTFFGSSLSTDLVPVNIRLASSHLTTNRCGSENGVNIDPRN